jgi:hypothetical protein
MGEACTSRRQSKNFVQSLILKIWIEEETWEQSILKDLKQEGNVWTELNWLKVGFYGGLWYANEPSSYIKGG